MITERISLKDKNTLDFDIITVAPDIFRAPDRRKRVYTRLPKQTASEDGAEIDLLFERGGKPEIAIEIKRSSAPTFSRGFHSARQALKVEESYLVHGGTGTWPESDGVTAIGLVELMRKLAK